MQSISWQPFRLSQPDLARLCLLVDPPYSSKRAPISRVSHGLQTDLLRIREVSNVLFRFTPVACCQLADPGASMCSSSSNGQGIFYPSSRTARSSLQLLFVSFLVFHWSRDRLRRILTVRFCRSFSHRIVKSRPDPPFKNSNGHVEMPPAIDASGSKIVRDTEHTSERISLSFFRDFEGLVQATVVERCRSWKG